MLCTAIATFVPHGERRAQSGPPQCFTVFVHALTVLDATGVWGCMSDGMHQAYYVQHGWWGDKDLQKHLFGTIIAAKQTTVVTTFPDNPVKACAPNAAGAVVCVNTWLVHYQIFDSLGAPAEVCSVAGCGTIEATFTVTMDNHGLMGSIAGG
jgi:hypothetical protein